MRMLASALRRNVGDGTFEDLEQRLLHALTADVARDRGVVAFAADLVDLVVVDGDGELLFGALLADDVEVEKLLDLFRLRKLAGTFHRARLILAVFSNDVETDVDAFVADVNGRARDQLLYIALALVAEAA